MIQTIREETVLRRQHPWRRDKSATDIMIEELQAAEEALALLDEYACAQVGGIPGALYKAYRDVQDARDAALKYWNEEASCGLHDRFRMLYRCDNAQSPYHSLTEDGACDLYTTEFRPVQGGVEHLCEVCREKENSG